MCVSTEDIYLECEYFYLRNLEKNANIVWLPFLICVVTVLYGYYLMSFLSPRICSSL